MDNKLTAQALNAKLPYLFNGEIEYLEELGKSLPNGANVVILGAGPGLASLSLFQGNPSLNIMAIDHNQATLDTYKAHLTAGGYPSTCVCTDTCDPLFFGLAAFGTIVFADLVVVDADHSAVAVTRDIDHWFPCIKSGGLIFFHDVVDLELNETNGVQQAIQESLSGGAMYMEAELVASLGISEVYKKI